MSVNDQSDYNQVKKPSPRRRNHIFVFLLLLLRLHPTLHHTGTTDEMDGVTGEWTLRHDLITDDDLEFLGDIRPDLDLVDNAVMYGNDFSAADEDMEALDQLFPGLGDNQEVADALPQPEQAPPPRPADFTQQQQKPTVLHLPNTVFSTEQVSQLKEDPSTEVVADIDLPLIVDHFQTTKSNGGKSMEEMVLEENKPYKIVSESIDSKKDIVEMALDMSDDIREREIEDYMGEANEAYSIVVEYNSPSSNLPDKNSDGDKEEEQKPKPLIGKRRRRRRGPDEPKKKKYELEAEELSDLSPAEAKKIRQAKNAKRNRDLKKREMEEKDARIAALEEELAIKNETIKHLKKAAQAWEGQQQQGEGKGKGKGGPFKNSRRRKGKPLVCRIRGSLPMGRDPNVGWVVVRN